MAKKIKHGAQRPPLSGIDRLLYFLLIHIFVGLMFFTLIYFGFILPDKLHRDSSDVIWKECGTSHLSALPLCFLWLATSIFILFGKKRCIPIFGNPRYKPKIFSPTVKVYPISSPQFRDNFTNQERKFLRSFGILFSIYIPLSLLIYPLGLYPRDLYLDNNTIVHYNIFNQEVYREHISSAQSLKIHTRSHGKHSSSIYPALTISFEDEYFTFDISDFERALYIKSQFPNEQIKITTSNRTLKRLISQMQSRDPGSIPLLYELYDYTP